MMKKMSIGLAIIFFCLASCGGGGGGGDGGGAAAPEEAKYDASGVWLITQTFKSGWPADFAAEIQCDPGIISYELAQITQNGNTANMDGLAGTVNDDDYSFVYSGTDASGITTTVIIAFTLTSETTFSGTCRIKAQKGNVAAGVIYTFEAKKTQTPRYDATGKWNITAILQNQEGSGFSFDTEIPAYFLIEQDGNDITSMTDDKGHTYEGALSGADYYTSFTRCEGEGELLSVVCIFSLPSQTALEGTIIVNWTDGTNHWKGEFQILQRSGWGKPELIETDDNGYAVEPQIAMDSSGNACAVWSQLDSALNINNIYANHFVVGVGWGGATLIEQNTNDAMLPQITVDLQGNASAVWVQNGIAFNRYSSDGGWGNPQSVTDVLGSFDHDIALDPQNNVIVIWYQKGTLVEDSLLLLRRYSATSGWGQSEVVASNVQEGCNPQIALDSYGNVIAVWGNWDGTGVWASRYTPSSGWGAAELIEGFNGGSSSPQIVMQPNGNATAVWSQWDGMNYRITATRYTRDNGWSQPEFIDQDNLTTSQYPQLAVDQQGKVYAVWSQSDGTRYNIWINSYSPGTGWDTARLISRNDQGNACLPQVSIDKNGIVFVVWYQSNSVNYGTDSIWSNRYDPVSGWGRPELVDISNKEASFPQIAVNQDGKAIVVWQQNDEGIWSHIWASVFE